MATALSFYDSNPISHFDADLRQRIIGDDIGIFEALHRQEKRAKANGEKIAPALEQAKKTILMRKFHADLKKNNAPGFLREIAEDHRYRLFLSKDEYLSFGKRLKQTIKKFAKGINSNNMIHFPFLNAAQYFASLISYEKLPEPIRKHLTDIGSKHTNQGPGIGPTNERRAAVALAILKDAGIIRGFQVCGEAGKPMRMMHELKSDTERLDYSHHEEAMAVDILVNLSNGKNFIYVPLQIKSSGSIAYDTKVRYLTFNSAEKQKLEKLIPHARNCFEMVADKHDSYRLQVKRKVMKLSLKGRKLVKEHKKDFEPDLVNKLMAMLEYAQTSGESLLLNKPYQKLDYVEKVVSMIKSGFLTPVQKDDAESVFVQLPPNLPPDFYQDYNFGA